MKKLLLLVAALALLAARADAQTKTTVTATIVDPSGIPYANGSVTASLTPAGVSNPTVGGAAIGGFVGPAVTDNNGHFSMDLFCNSAGGGCSPISPANTKWQFTVCNPGVPSPLGFGNQCFTPAAITITGATQDVSTQMNAVAPLLTRLAGATVTPGAPTGACSNGALAIDSTTGILYTCQSNAWVPVTPTSGVGAPVGSCTPRQLYVDTSTGSLYTCNGGVWTPAAGGGTGTVTSFSYSSTNLAPLMTSAVTNPSTTPNLAQTAASTQPGMVLAGPIPTAGANAFFDHTVAASGSSATISVTGTPSGSAGVTLFIDAALGQAAPIPGPAGFTAFDATANGNNASIYFKTFATNAQQTISTSITSGEWIGSASFLGGTISAVVNLRSVSGALGTGCHTTAAYTPTAGHSLLVFAQWGAGSSADAQITTVTDSVGSLFQQITAQSIPSPSVLGLAAYFLPTATAGSQTLTFCNSDSIASAVVTVYDVTGPAAYYSGTLGPYNFRFLTYQDIAQAFGLSGFTQIQPLIITSGICTPGSASTYDACQFTANWPKPFTDANYAAACFAQNPNANGGNPSTNVSVNVYKASQNASSITLIVQNNRSIAQTATEIDCIGAHP